MIHLLINMMQGFNLQFELIQGKINVVMES